MPLIPLEEYKPEEKKETTLVPLEEYEQNLIPLDTYEANAKKTEAELKVDPAWINASKKYYEFNMGADAPKLKSDEDYANYGLRQMGWFNYNLPNMTFVANKLSNAEQEDQLNFVNLMDMYDNKKISAAGTGRFIKGVAFDPSTYFGIGTLGLGLLGREGGKQGVKLGIRELVKNRAIKGAGFGAAEGAIYTAYDDKQRQKILTNAGLQDGYDVSRGLKSAGLGAVLGGTLGGTIGGVSGYVTGRKGLPIADEVTPTPKVEPSVEAPLTSKADIKKQIDDELIKLGVDPVKVDGVPKLSAKQGFMSPDVDIVPEDYGILGGRVSFKIDYDNPKNTANKLKDFFVKQNSLDNFKLSTPEVTPQPKPQKRPRSTTLPSILKQPPKPQKIKTARSLVFGVPKNDPNFEEIISAIGYDVNQVPATRTSRPIYRADGSPDSDYLDLLVEQFDELGFGAGRGGAGETMGIGVTKFDKEDVLEILEQDLVLPEFEEINLQYQVKLKQYEDVTSALDSAGIDPNSLRGKTDEEVLDIVSQINEAEDLTGARVSDSFAAQFQDQPPVSAYADEIASSDGGNINNIRAEDVIDPTPDGRDFQTDTTTGLNQRVIDVGMEILEELEIPKNNNVRISDQLKEAVLLANTNPKFYRKFVDTLQRNNLTVEELSSVFRESISDSARRMQQLSVAKQSMKRMGQELGEIAPDEGWYANFAKEYTDIIRDLDNIRRGLLVSQIATAMRNNTAQIGRVGMHTLTEIYDGILNATFNPIKRAFGKETKPVDHTKSFRLMMNLTKNKKQAKELTEFLTKYYVNESDRLFTKYASEVADSSKAKVLKSAQKMVDGLNFLNRMQEFWYRRGMFATSIQNTLANKGIDINKVGLNDDLLKYLSPDDISKAVDDSLYFTYAKTPDNKFLKSFVDISNSIPFVTTGVLPFARFMANAIEFQFKHSPVGFGLLLRPKEIKKIAAGDTTAFSQAVVGSTLLLATIEAKRKGMGEDHKWYELETKSEKLLI